MIYHLDLETRSPVDLKTCGVHRYAEEAEVIIAASAFNNAPVMSVPWSELTAAAVQNDIDKADVVVVHGAEFERTLLRTAGIELPIEKTFCTMAAARRHGLPGGLDKLCGIFKLPEDKAKQKIGSKLIRLFCVPNPDSSWNTVETHPAEWAQFLEYAGFDVVSMREIYGLLPTWNNEIERPFWEHDQIINDRGFAVDRQFAAHTVLALTDATKVRNQRTSELTGGEVTAATQRDRLLKHLLKEHGVDLPDLTASTLERRLADPDLPDEVHELLLIRQQSARTSTSKYSTVLRCVNEDGRLRGWAVYCGAGRTKRYAGAKFQPHNMPRRPPNISVEEVAWGVRALRSGVLAALDPDIPLADYAAAGVRGCVVAAKGCELVISDFSNIEGRLTAWFGREEWKLDAFRSYDAGTGPDLYRRAYADAFNVDIESIDTFQRQIGKVMELLLGFGGGVGAFITGSITYKFDLWDLTEAAWPLLPDDVKAETGKMWQWACDNNRTLGLHELVFRACDGLKRLWRRRHRGVERLWYDTEDAAKTTILTGEPQDVAGGLIQFDKVGNWLRMRLPSGSYLSYPSPRLVEKKDGSTEIRFTGMNTYTRQWGWQSTWGGTLVENFVQGTARELLVRAMLDAEQGLGDVVLHVHDEPVLEAPIGAVVPEELNAILERDRGWTAGLPLKAEGFVTQRYYKK